jgi:phosphoribosylanthranilate isomerase
MTSALARTRDLMHVKVCGITQLMDAQAALSCGATMLGFILGNEVVQVRLMEAASTSSAEPSLTAAPSLRQKVQTAVFNQRHVLLKSVALIYRELDKSTERIGVFHNASREFILRSFEVGSLTGVQLHGDESVEFVAKIRADLGADIFLSKAVEPSREANRLQKYLDYSSSCSALLFDVPKAQQAAKKVLDLHCLIEMRPPYPFFIAGGLSQLNVADYLAELSPDGVDVCSAVEESPGRKDHGKLRDFFTALQRARHDSLVIQRS